MGVTLWASVWMFNLLRAGQANQWTSLQAFRLEMRAEFKDVRDEMTVLRTELKGEMSEMRTAVTGLSGRVYGLAERVKGLEVCQGLRLPTEPGEPS